jgi:hypothetical protein
LLKCEVRMAPFHGEIVVGRVGLEPTTTRL